MKNITLLILLLCLNLNAQQTISFEPSEGYSLGDVNGQNGWISYQTPAGNFVSNQVISDENSTDGNQSLKITKETSLPDQDLVVGGYYSYPNPIDYTNASFSFDIYIDEPSTLDDSDYAFLLTNDDSSMGTTIIAGLLFSFDNAISLLDGNTGDDILVGTWVSDTWYNFRIEITNNQVEYFIDDSSIGTYGIINSENITGARFVHDNYEGTAYLYNFKTNQTLSISDYQTSNFDYYLDTQNQLNLSADQSLDQIELHNLLGEKVLSQKLFNQQSSISLDALPSGVYLAKLKINNAIKTFKIIKM